MPHVDAPALPAGVTPITPVTTGDVAPAHPAHPAQPPTQRIVSTELKTSRHDEPGDDDPEPRLLRMLPREMVESVAFPLPYHLSETTGFGGVAVRSAESALARARAYPCVPFYKPISRCVGGAS
jgi:hypothetical protein